MTALHVLPLPLVAEVTAGDDLASHVLAALQAAGERLEPGDVLCVASKVVAKAEGATVPLPPGDPGAARRTVARQHAAEVVADTPWVLVVRTHHGFVCANAGVDASNMPGGERLLLLPHDPDASASRLREDLHAATGTAPGVVVTDTFGRAWRLGQVDVALGAAGVGVLRDERGGTDRDGRRLDVTQVAVADQLAAAADLVRTKADGTPFVLLRGLDASGDQTAGDLLRPPAQDLFRHGGPDAVAVGNAAARLVADGEDHDGENHDGENHDRGQTVVPVDGGGQPPGGGSTPDGATVRRVAAAARDALLDVDVEVHTAGLTLLGADPVALGAALQAASAAATALGLDVALRRGHGRLRLHLTTTPG